MQIFISYSRRDNEFARGLHDKLGNAGFDIWRDETSIRANDDWTEAIASGLASSDVMIVVLSNASMASEAVRKEWFYFIEEKKPIVCLWLEDCQVHFQLRPLQRIDFRTTKDHEKALVSLINELSLIAHKATDKLFQATEPSFPFDGSAVDLHLDWHDVRNHANSQTNLMLSSRYRDKYVSGLYSHRELAKGHLNSFLESAKSCLVVTGKAGIGKSSFICDFAKDPPLNVVVWLQDCAI